MAEIEDTALNQQFNDDGTENANYVAPKVEGEGEAPITEKKGDEEEGKPGEGKEDEFDDAVEPAIPIRQSVAQHIIARKNEKIKKLEALAAKPAEEEPYDDGSYDDLAVGDQESIDKRIDAKIAPLLKSLVSKADEDEVNALFTTEPEAKKYAQHIKAYMGHDMYKGVPPSVIYHHLAFNNAQAVGAKRKQAADFEASQARGGGRVVPPKGSSSDIPSAEDIQGMSEEEFEKMENDARQGKFINK